MKKQVIPAFKKTLAVRIYLFEEENVKAIKKFIKGNDESLEYIEELQSGFVLDSLQITGNYLYAKVLATKKKEITVIEHGKIEDKKLNIVEEGFVVIGGGYMLVKGAKLVKDTLTTALRPKYEFYPATNIRFPPERLKKLVNECTMGRKVVFNEVDKEDMDEITYKGDLCTDFAELEEGLLKNFSAEFVLDGLRIVSFNQTGSVSISAKKLYYTEDFLNAFFDLLDGVCE